jgi:prolyl 4-hydroxylase
VPTFLAKTKRLLNNLSVKQMEEAQIVRYRPGEEFTWHYDEIPSAQLSNGGQRIATLLVYLNTIQKGGGTIFRDLRDVTGSMLTMRPKRGSALLFFPAYIDGVPDDRTLHKGEMAVEQKMIAQMWIHEREYTPIIPEGNNHEDALDAIKAKEIELGYCESES